MGEYAKAEALRSYGRFNPKPEIHKFPLIPCPICGKEVGGRSAFTGEQGRLAGVHQHMKAAHQMKRKRDRDDLLAAYEGEKRDG